MNLYSIENLSFRYPDSKNDAIDNITLDIQQGEFVLICGESGSGKSTLLRQLKTAIAPNGQKTGTISFEGVQLEKCDHRVQSEKIGFVSQDAENQIVTDKVWHELAFGLESLGIENDVIRRRVAEITSFFGIQSWFHKSTMELSGGQKQILNLASVMIMQPEVLILDEPTSQLDPIAADEFIHIIKKIHTELGTTIIIVEHSFDKIMSLSSRVLALRNGKIIADNTPGQIIKQLKSQSDHLFEAMPVPAKIWYAVSNHQEQCPLDVNTCRKWLGDYCSAHNIKNSPLDTNNKKIIIENDKKDITVSINNIWYRYSKGAQDVLKGVKLQAKAGEILAILGENGTGKSTLLSVISGSGKPYRGSVVFYQNEKKISSSKISIGFLPQNAVTLFVKKTVQEDLYDMLDHDEYKNREREIEEVVKLCKLKHLLANHPFDLSGGEKQRLALAKLLLLKPDILLLDEPTKGLDKEFIKIFSEILQELKTHGITTIMVTHDIEFCAENANRCAMLFDGSIVSVNQSRKFFENNSFYTTIANKISRNIINNAITTKDVIEACNGIEVKKDQKKQQKQNQQNKPEQPHNTVKHENVEEEISETPQSVKVESKQKTLKSEQFRKMISIFIIFLLIPITIYTGVTVLNNQKYLFIAVVVLLECFVPFLYLFEGRKPQAREIVMIAVLCAIGITGRAVFYMLPQFKPVIAVVIISGVAFGYETGFLVGAVTMLVSNIMFQQGPWTPWQMFAMGLIGYFSGLVFYEKKIPFRTIVLSVFGFICSVVIYGGIMNPASAIISHAVLNKKTLIAYYSVGLPIDVVQGIATMVFLIIISKPLLEKLDRIKLKYNLYKTK